MLCVFFTADAATKCPLGLEEVSANGTDYAVRHCPCSDGSREPQCKFPKNRRGGIVTDLETFRNAYLSDLNLPPSKRRFPHMTTETASAVAAPEPEDSGQGGTIRGLTLYERIPDPMKAVNDLGMAICKSKMFGCPNDEVGLNQGRVIAMTCLAERITPFDFLRRYHIMGGKATMQANAMLAEFVRRGGEYEVVSATADRAEVILRKGKTRGQQTYTSSITWEEAAQEPWPYNNDAANGKIKKRLADGSINPNALKTNWATPRARSNMLWARAVSEGVRRFDCTVNHGVYTPEEVSDYAGITYVPPESNVSPVIPPAAPAAEPVIDAEYTPAAPAANIAKADVAPAVTNSPEGYKASPEQLERLKALKAESGVASEHWKEWLGNAGVDSATKLSPPQADLCEQWLRKLIAAKSPAPAAATSVAPPADPIRPEQVERLKALKTEFGIAGDAWKAYLAEYGVDSAAKLTSLDATRFEAKTRFLEEAKRKASTPVAAPATSSPATSIAPFDATNATAAPGPATAEQLDKLKHLVTQILKLETADWKQRLSAYGATSAKELNSANADCLLSDLMKLAEERGKRDELSAWADSALAKN